MSGNVDEQVVRSAQQGERSAQEAVLRELGPTVAALVRRLGSWRDGEDETQAVFAHLLEVLPKFDPRGSGQLSTWAHTVVHRWLLMQRRRRAPELVSIEGGLGVPSPVADASEYVEEQQLKQLLERELRQLPDELRTAFVLTQLNGLSLQTVAETERVPVGTVKSRLHRARALLVLRLGPALDRVGTPGRTHAAAR